MLVLDMIVIDLLNPDEVHVPEKPEAIPVKTKVIDEKLYRKRLLIITDNGIEEWEE